MKNDTHLHPHADFHAYMFHHFSMGKKTLPDSLSGVPRNICACIFSFSRASGREEMFERGWELLLIRCEHCPIKLPGTSSSAHFLQIREKKSEESNRPGRVGTIKKLNQPSIWRRTFTSQSEMSNEKGNSLTTGPRPTRDHGITLIRKCPRSTPLHVYIHRKEKTPPPYLADPNFKPMKNESNRNYLATLMPHGQIPHLFALFNASTSGWVDMQSWLKSPTNLLCALSYIPISYSKHI